MQQEDEIHGILPNLDQAKFIELANRAKDKLCRRSPDPVSLIGYNGPGRAYRDYVVSIRASKDGKKFEVYRNRDGVLVLAMDGTDVRAINYEYIFIDRHLRSKLGEPLDG
jgi:hypothetical protein